MRKSKNTRVTVEEFNGIKMAQKAGVKCRDAHEIFARSTGTMWHIYNADTFEEYKANIRAKGTKLKAKSAVADLPSVTPLSAYKQAEMEAEQIRKDSEQILSDSEAILMAVNRVADNIERLVTAWEKPKKRLF